MVTNFANDMLKKLKIKYKILTIPLLAMITFLMFQFVIQHLNKGNEKIQWELEIGYFPSLELSWDLEKVLPIIQRLMQDAVAASDAEMLKKTSELYDYFIRRCDEGKKYKVMDVARLSLLQKEFQDYYNLARRTSMEMIQGAAGKDVEANLEIMTTDYNRIKNYLASTTANDKDKMKLAFSALKENQKTLINTLRTMTILSILLLGGVSLLLSQSITKPLKEVVKISNQFAEGREDVQIQVRSTDEVGVLGNAINDMIQKIVKSKQEIELQNWFKTGLTDLNDHLRGELDLATMTQNILNHLASFLSIQVGTIYLSENNNRLKMIASYAYSRREHLANSFELGEGLVGQAALEKKSILITHVPEDYVVVQSGLGEAKPRYILVCPFLFENRVKGVIELGSFQEITDVQMKFLEQALENIAVNINTAQSRQQLKKQKNDIEKKNQQLEAVQREIERKAADLELTSKYKSEFLANMSHELRTPLNSMLILSKLIFDNKEGNLTTKQIEFAKTIHSSGSDLLNLINDSLDLSKVEAGKMDLHLEDVDLRELAANIHRNFQYLAREKSLGFNIDFDDDTPTTIYTDRQRLEQIIKNLLSNAFKYTEKGMVRLNFRNANSDDQLFYDTQKLAATIAIQVSDTGIGIAEEKQRLIFEAFQQADGSISRKYQGTGLGLSISRELSKLLEGEIHLQSTVGAGSSFTIFLPLRHTAHDENIALYQNKPDDRPTEAKAETIALPVLRKENNRPDIDDREQISSIDRVILIIEDDFNFAKILLDLTHEKGFKGVIAENGEIGIHFAFHYKPNAIILDIGLPGMDGWAVMERLKGNPELRHIPVHFISASENSLKARRMGAIGFLSKPVSIDDLENAFKKIEEIISRRVKNLLVVEDDELQRNSILELIGDGDVNATDVDSGNAAYDLLKTKKFDCMILDLGLEDLSGFDLLEKIRGDEVVADLPIIIYTGKELTPDEENCLRKYTESVIIKGVKSPEQLLDETMVFLHRVEANLPEKKKEILRMVHEKEAVLKNKKILLVDDDMRNLFALSSILEEQQMTVVTAKNGSGGLERLQRESGINLILMDIMMPELDGYETMKIIRSQEKFKKLPIIALTAKAMKGDRMKCIEAGANDYLSKPVDAEKLLSLLRIWLYR